MGVKFTLIQRFISFYLQGHLVRYNGTSGVLPMDDKLTLRNIKKSAAGEYSCSATNTEGETYSPPFRLEVQCKYAHTSRVVRFFPFSLSHRLSFRLLPRFSFYSSDFKAKVSY